MGQLRNNFIFDATFLKAVDGDTVDLEVDLGFNTFKRMRFRLKGVNTPERGQPGYKEATDFVREWFETHNFTCLVDSKKAGKYGRWLAICYVPALSQMGGKIVLNEQLLETGHAVRYE